MIKVSVGYVSNHQDTYGNINITIREQKGKEGIART
jgi:hypothetical protein